MKIFSSSPYATFNPKEWNSVPRANNKFSNTPIRVKKSYFSTFKNIKSKKISQEKKHQSKQMQLALA